MSHKDLTIPAPVDDVSTLSERPSVLLSASVPVHRNPQEFEPAERETVQHINIDYAATARPERIRAAVASLARVAFLRDVRLVFGAHPTISPMILQVAQGINAADDSVLIFQSAAYLNQIPKSTLKLANWSKATLVLTQAQAEAGFIPTPGIGTLKRVSPYPNSLKFMRELMMSVPGIMGAVFIGGMDGVEKEAELFALNHAQLRRYALGSTGAAAQRLLQQQPAGFHGSIQDPRAFHSTTSYPVASSMILDDLIPSPARHP